MIKLEFTKIKLIYQVLTLFVLAERKSEGDQGEGLIYLYLSNK